MEVQELAIAAQSLSFEQRKELIETISSQLPKPSTQSTGHIIKTLGVCGGKACVTGTRVRVMDVVIWHERLGWSADQIVSEIPNLTLGDVYASLAYYFDHREEIEEDIRLNDEIAGRLRVQQPSKLPANLTN